MHECSVEVRSRLLVHHTKKYEKARNAACNASVL